MGRTEKSKGLAPPAVRKDVRAKQARHIINKTIPAILLSNSRARQGAENSQLIANPDAIAVPSTVSDKAKDANASDHRQQEEEGQGKPKDRKQAGELEHASVSSTDASPSGGTSSDHATNKLSIKIVCTDCLSTAEDLADPTSKFAKKQANVCILNMASPLRPGGGVLNGATSQEEFLCARTTLLPSLKESFYRLPEVGGIFTRDVLVFRNSQPLNNAKGEILTGNRFWVDVISAGMLRFPELQGEDPENQHWSAQDRTLAEAKMRAVLRIAASHGTRKLVLGAWGCGAYGNPVVDVAETWKSVLQAGEMDHQNHDNLDTWRPIKEVVFAITNRTMAQQFADVFGLPFDEEGPLDVMNEEERGQEDEMAQELNEKIKQLGEQVARARNVELKSRLQIILDDLGMQLQKHKRQTEEEDMSEDDCDS